MIHFLIFVEIVIYGMAISDLENFIAYNKPCVNNEWWEDKYSNAKNYMSLRHRGGDSILIISTSQHPLINGIFVGKEFTERLNSAYIFSRMCQNESMEFYVPASIHKDMGISDKISTSHAAKNYLISKGINPYIIHGDDLNLKYKGNDGVYNSADEAYVTAQYFHDNKKFKEIFVFCSPDQRFRWGLHSVANGVLPKFTEVSTPESISRTKNGRGGFGDLTIYYTLLYDPTWQKDSFLGNLSRKIRRP